MGERTGERTRAGERTGRADRWAEEGGRVEIYARRGMAYRRSGRSCGRKARRAGELWRRRAPAGATLAFSATDRPCAPGSGGQTVHRVISIIFSGDHCQRDRRCTDVRRAMPAVRPPVRSVGGRWGRRRGGLESRGGRRERTSLARKIAFLRV